MNARKFSVVAVAALSVVAASCGSNNNQNAQSGSTTTTTAAARQDIAADKVLAEQASLKLSDFPAGWTSQPASKTNENKTLDDQLASCLGVSPSQLTVAPASYDSPTFSDSNNNSASSTTSYRATAAEQKSAFDYFSSPKAPACFSKAIQAVINDAVRHPSNPSDTLPASATIGQPAFSPMSFPTFGDATVAYQVKLPISFSGLSIDAYADLISSIKGRAAVLMSFQGVGQPFPTDQAQHYTDLVVGRLMNT